MNFGLRQAALKVVLAGVCVNAAFAQANFTPSWPSQTCRVVIVHQDKSATEKLIAKLGFWGSAGSVISLIGKDNAEIAMVAALISAAAAYLNMTQHSDSQTTVQICPARSTFDLPSVDHLRYYGSTSKLLAPAPR